MAVTYGVFNKGLYNIVAGTIHYLTDTLKIALFPSTYTPNVDSQHFFSDISASECPDTGNYTAGGQEITNKTLTEDDTGDAAVADCDNPSWALLTQADIRIAVLYKDTGDPATSVLLMYWDFGSTQAPAGETFELPVPVAGLFDVKKAT